jgi:hypothetical protein
MSQFHGLSVTKWAPFCRDKETKISSVEVNLSKKIDGTGGKEEVDFLKAESQKQAT